MWLTASVCFTTTNISNTLIISIIFQYLQHIQQPQQTPASHAYIYTYSTQSIVLTSFPLFIAGTFSIHYAIVGTRRTPCEHCDAFDVLYCAVRAVYCSCKHPASIPQASCRHLRRAPAHLSQCSQFIVSRAGKSMWMSMGQRGPAWTPIWTEDTGQSERPRDRQTDRSTDRQTNRPTDQLG